MSGFELIARLRTNEATAHTPVIVITSKDVTVEDRELMRGQIADVIRKGDLLMPDLEARLRETLEEIGVKPSDGEDTVS
jgi:PleD family two-component response regulator